MRTGGQRRKRKSRRLLYLVVVVVVLAAGVLTVRLVTNAPPSILESPRKAVFINQISVTWPNEQLVDSIEHLFREAEIPLDIFNQSDVDVDFYYRFPAMGYGIAVFRVHAATFVSDPDPQKPIFLFTSEPYVSQKYPSLEQAGQVFSVRTTPDAPLYFGVSPSFIGYGTLGRLQNTLVLMMGCEGLLTTSGVVDTQLARAFVDKGASAFVSWDGFVTPSHTDLAAIQLLRLIVNDGSSVSRAVGQIGPDPQERSVLRYYPFDLGDYVWRPQSRPAMISLVLGMNRNPRGANARLAEWAEFSPAV